MNSNKETAIKFVNLASKVIETAGQQIYFDALKIHITEEKDSIESKKKQFKFYTKVKIEIARLHEEGLNVAIHF